jgi:hypothetical protein
MISKVVDSCDEVQFASHAILPGDRARTMTKELDDAAMFTHAVRIGPEVVQIWARDCQAKASCLSRSESGDQTL